MVMEPLLLASVAYEGANGEVEDGRRVEGGGGRRGRVENILPNLNVERKLEESEMNLFNIR